MSGTVGEEIDLYGACPLYIRLLFRNGFGHRGDCFFVRSSMP